MPNNLLRDLQSIHPNASFADLPKGLQDSIKLSARAAFTKLSKDGYSVTPTSMAPQSRPIDRVPDRQRSGPGDRRGPPRSPVADPAAAARAVARVRVRVYARAGAAASGPLTSPADAASAVLHFWFDEVGKQRWFAKDEKLDAEIARRFGKLRDAVVVSDASGWREELPTLTAAIILIDQFSRNIHRGSAKAFVADPLALDLTMAVLDRDWVAKAPEQWRAFLLMPLMHSEDLAVQDRSLVEFAKLGNSFTLSRLRPQTPRSDHPLHPLSRSQQGARPGFDGGGKSGNEGRRCILG